MFIYQELDNHIYYFKLGNLTKAEFENYINIFDSIYEKEEKFKVIFDLRQSKFKDVCYSKMNNMYMKKNLDNTQKYIEKTSIIITSSFIKTLLKRFIFAIYKPIKPNLITNNIKDAKTFLKIE